MTALELDKESLNILEEKQSELYIELQTDETRTATPIYPKIRLKNVVTDHTTTKLTRLLNVIGENIVIYILGCIILCDIFLSII
jgi:hypothetical protein